jgi:hypothetical protein
MYWSILDPGRAASCDMFKDETEALSPRLARLALVFWFWSPIGREVWEGGEPNPEPLMFMLTRFPEVIGGEMFLEAFCCNVLILIFEFLY